MKAQQTNPLKSKFLTQLNSNPSLLHSRIKSQTRAVSALAPMQESHSAAALTQQQHPRRQQQQNRERPDSFSFNANQKGSSCDSPSDKHPSGSVNSNNAKAVQVQHSYRDENVKVSVERPTAKPAHNFKQTRKVPDQPILKVSHPDQRQTLDGKKEPCLPTCCTNQQSQEQQSDQALDKKLPLEESPSLEQESSSGTLQAKKQSSQLFESVLSNRSKQQANLIALPNFNITKVTQKNDQLHIVQGSGKSGEQVGRSMYERSMRHKAVQQEWLKKQNDINQQKLEQQCTFTPRTAAAITAPSARSKSPNEMQGGRQYWTDDRVAQNEQFYMRQTQWLKQKEKKIQTVQAKKKEREDQQLVNPQPVIYTKNRYPTIMDLNKTGAVAVTQHQERMQNARMHRIATEKRLDLRSSERTDWRPTSQTTTAAHQQHMNRSRSARRMRDNSENIEASKSPMRPKVAHNLGTSKQQPRVQRTEGLKRDALLQNIQRPQNDMMSDHSNSLQSQFGKPQRSQQPIVYHEPPNTLNTGNFADLHSQIQQL